MVKHIHSKFLFWKEARARWVLAFYGRQLRGWLFFCILADLVFGKECAIEHYLVTITLLLPRLLSFVDTGIKSRYGSGG